MSNEYAENKLKMQKSNIDVENIRKYSHLRLKVTLNTCHARLDIAYFAGSQQMIF